MYEYNNNKLIKYTFLCTFEWFECVDNFFMKIRICYCSTGQFQTDISER